MGGFIKKGLFGLLAILLIVIVGAYINPLPGEGKTPAGYTQNTALYIEAKDGVKLAIDVWLPENLKQGEKIPALIEGSRYWRALKPTLLGRILYLFGQSAPGIGLGYVENFFNERGYATILVDVRGTGASFGVHQSEYSPEEMADYASIIDWIIAQPWSNGNVGTQGVSYAGTTAELIATTGHPALKAAAPLYSDFDAIYHLGTPGGAFAPGFMAVWSASVDGMDRNDVCAVAGGLAKLEGLDCFMAKLLVGGVKPVDDNGDALLEFAITEHNSPNVEEAVKNLQARDSEYANSGIGLGDTQPYGWKDEIEASNVPMFIMSGWMDAATADGTLARFHDFSNKQTIYIGPFNHGGGEHTGPFLPPETPSIWPAEERYGRVEAFFSYYLKGEGTPPETGLNYYIMNEGGWRKTDVWPPAGRRRETRYFDSSQIIDTQPHETSFQKMGVDFSAGTGPQTRWLTQMGGGDVVYDDRRSQNGKVLRFTSQVLESDLVLAGNIIIDLYLSSTVAEPTLHVYLEDVAPEGRITYLTEGILQTKHHQISSDKPLYYHDGPYRSFLKKDVKPLKKDEVTKITIPLYATAIKIEKGHRYQISIAGADKDVFQAYEQDNDPEFTILTGPDHPSQISLPILDLSGRRVNK